MLIKTITHKNVCLHKGVIWRINAIITHWTTWIDTQTFLWRVGVISVISHLWKTECLKYLKYKSWLHLVCCHAFVCDSLVKEKPRVRTSCWKNTFTHSHLDTEDFYSWKNNHLMDISHTFKVEMSSMTSASLCWTLLFAYLLCVSAGETERVLNATGFFLIYEIIPHQEFCFVIIIKKCV